MEDSGVDRLTSVWRSIRSRGDCDSDYHQPLNVAGKIRRISLTQTGPHDVLAHFRAGLCVGGVSPWRRVAGQLCFLIVITLSAQYRSGAATAGVLHQALSGIAALLSSLALERLFP